MVKSQQSHFFNKVVPKTIFGPKTWQEHCFVILTYLWLTGDNDTNELQPTNGNNSNETAFTVTGFATTMTLADNVVAAVLFLF